MKWLAVLLVLALPAAYGAREDLVNCRYENGRHIDYKVCEILRRAEQEDQAERARQQAERAAAVERERELKAKRDAQEEEFKRQMAERREREAAEQQARRDEFDRQQAEEEKAQRHQEKIAAEKKRALMAECGDDFAAPRVGMTLARAQQCVRKFRLKGQVNRTDGVVSTYTGGDTYLHVMDGRVIAWGRL